MENSTTEAPARREGDKFGKFNQSHFTLLYIALTIGIITVAFTYFNPETGPSYSAAIRIVAASMQSVALWVASAVGFAAALNGLKCDLYKEVVEQHNMAIAILLGLAWLSIALVIHG